MTHPPPPPSGHGLPGPGESSVHQETVRTTDTGDHVIDTVDERTGPGGERVRTTTSAHEPPSRRAYTDEPPQRVVRENGLPPGAHWDNEPRTEYVYVNDDPPPGRYPPRTYGRPAPPDDQRVVHEEYVDDRRVTHDHSPDQTKTILRWILIGIAGLILLFLIVYYLVPWLIRERYTDVHVVVPTVPATTAPATAPTVNNGATDNDTTDNGTAVDTTIGTITASGGQVHFNGNPIRLWLNGAGFAQDKTNDINLNDYCNGPVTVDNRFPPVYSIRCNGHGFVLDDICRTARGLHSQNPFEAPNPNLSPAGSWRYWYCG
jgi:hypothetical protein